MDNQINIQLNKLFGYKVLTSTLIGGYSKRVWEIQTDSHKYVIKLLEGQSEKDLLHHHAEVAFSSIVNSTGVLETVKFISDTKGDTIHRIDKNRNDYFVVIESHPIIKKTNLNSEEQQELGHLMSVLHAKLKGFAHPGLGNTKYMREVNTDEMKLINEAFPDAGYKNYLKFMQPLDYQALDLKTTVIHGDWHQANMSFTQPPFIFDLDTIAWGARVEELARTLTHWWVDPSEVKDLYRNLIIGYATLTQSEIDIIPSLIIAQQYRKYAEYRGYKDPINAERVKESIPVLKSLFSLS